MSEISGLTQVAIVVRWLPMDTAKKIIKELDMFTKEDVLREIVHMEEYPDEIVKEALGTFIFLLHKGASDRFTNPEQLLFSLANDIEEQLEYVKIVIETMIER